MSRTSIRALIDAHVAAIPGIPTLQLENTRNTATTGSAFSRVTLLPARSRPASVGRNGSDRHSGLVQIDLFYPASAGTTAIEAMADVVVASFTRGLSLTDGDITVHFSTPSIDAGYTFTPFYCLPVVVEWSSVVPAQ